MLRACRPDIPRVISRVSNLYRDAAKLIRARQAGITPDPAALAAVPTVIDGAKGIRFVEAAVQSSRTDGRWTSAKLESI